jgi:hypothetical protein
VTRPTALGARRVFSVSLPTSEFGLNPDLFGLKPETFNLKPS